MSAKHHFTVRDVVRLVAGGPEMTVEGPGAITGHVWCTWMAGRYYHGGSFDEGVLIRVDGPVEDLSSGSCDKRFHTPLIEIRMKAKRRRQERVGKPLIPTNSCDQACL